MPIFSVDEGCLVWYINQTRVLLAPFFVLKNALRLVFITRREMKCVQELHLLAQNARIVTTIQRRIRSFIQTEWKQINTADSVRDILYIRKQSNIH